MKTISTCQVENLNPEPNTGRYSLKQTFKIQGQPTT
jgi:hypothetical protein